MLQPPVVARRDDDDGGNQRARRDRQQAGGDERLADLIRHDLRRALGAADAGLQPAAANVAVESTTTMPGAPLRR